MAVRRLWIAAAGVLAPVVGAVTLPASPAVHMVPPTVACLLGAVLVGYGPTGRRLIPAAAVAMAGTSAATTVAVVVLGHRESPAPFPTPLWMIAEPVALAAFGYLVVRWATPRRAWWVGVALAPAAATVVQRYAPATDWESVAGGAMWLIPSIVAGVIAWYLRGLATARQRAVVDVRRRQRLELAGDLHDFVAHDVSEIVAQAQAGRMVLDSPDPRVAQVLERIETAGLRALASMDRTLDMLREADRQPVGGLSELTELVERFASAGTVTPRLVMRGPADRVPRETAAVAYRVVVEALTNVRRHATDATRVTVSAVVDDATLTITVDDDGRGPGRRIVRASAGQGVPGLAARAAALDGTLTAGRRTPRGWRLSARFPLPDNRKVST